MLLFLSPRYWLEMEGRCDSDLQLERHDDNVLDDADSAPVFQLLGNRSSSTSTSLLNSPKVRNPAIPIASSEKHTPLRQHHPSNASSGVDRGGAADGAVAPDSTVPWERGSPYTSPRRRTVPGGTLHAATLLDSARNTVALLTEEVVALRRENAILHKRATQNEQSAQNNQKLHGQVAALRKELDTVKQERIASTSRGGELQRQVAALLKRVEELSARERKLAREKHILEKDAAASRDELHVVKLVSKQTIERLLNQLEGSFLPR